MPFLRVLVVNTAVASLIREAKSTQIASIMQTGKNVGMITMDESLRQLYTQGTITQDEAYFRAEDKAQMKSYFES